MPLPSGGKYSKMTKVNFGGLNKKYTVDSGSLSMESNISTNEHPYLTPSYSREEVLSGYTHENNKEALSMYAFDDFLIVVYYVMNDSVWEDDKENGGLKEVTTDTVRVDYIKFDKSGNTIHTGLVKSGATYADKEAGSVVQFNVYDTPTDPLTGQFVKKLLFFPHQASMFMNIVEAESDPRGWEEEYKIATNKYSTKLYEADLGVMYFYKETNDNGDDLGTYYCVVGLEPTESGDDGYDENKVTYKRVVKRKYRVANQFLCDGMTALIKEFSPWKKITVDEETGDEKVETMNIPPDTASHNYYYVNKADATQIYRWVDDTVDSSNSGWKISLPPTMPKIKYAAVHVSRVFGVDDDRVYASGYNDYTNWNLDTIDEYNESNSWCSPSQANTKAGGKFTGITTFQGHVVCFKKDFMHEIYNTKNPFRLQDIYAEGTIDNRTIQDVDGKLIFVSEDNVKIYTGSNPRIISYNLNMPKYAFAVSGTDNQNYYLYCEDKNSSNNQYLYVYDTYADLWSEQRIDAGVKSFAHNSEGMYMLCDDGCVYKMDTGKHDHDWSFETELFTNQTVNIKHIKKLQMLVDVGDSANLKVYILYDNEIFDENKSHLVYSSTKVGKYPIRVKPRQTANYGFKLHVEGKGYVKIYELEMFVEAGGDMYV
jgi:hypothetical protein